MTPDALALACGISPGEARKVVSAVHRGRWIDEGGATRRPRSIQGVRRASLEAVHACARLEILEVCTTERSAIDPFVKLALATGDGHRIETVRIPLERKGRFSVCVSSQVGCALECAFCATGRLGLGRNLQSWEIVEQVRLVRATLGPGQRVHGVVFQGMGEPLANVESVLGAIRVLSDPCALSIDARAITVCTSGLPAGILRLARDAPRVRIGLSIGSARSDVRRRLMPIEMRYPLAQVLAAVEAHALETGLAPLWAVTPLAGINDTDDDVDALVHVALRFAQRTGIRPRLSIVPYNSIDEMGRDPFHRGDVDRFRSAMSARGFPAHLRYSGGSDVHAACGQLGRVL
jgi:23S rRNA (adenine2503-C2)-methyltransferase